MARIAATGCTAPPDHGGSAPAATRLCSASVLAGACSTPLPGRRRAVAEGLISSAADVDAFAFVADAAGPAEVSAGVPPPYSAGGYRPYARSDLNFTLTLRGPDSFGAVLATATRNDSIDASGVSLPPLDLPGPGTYWVTIAPVGWEGVYPAYGSIGTYTLDVAWPSSATGVDDLPAAPPSGAWDAPQLDVGG